MKDRLALPRETMGTVTFSLPLHPPQKMKMACMFLIATLSHQSIQDGWRDCVSVCRQKCETEKGGDLMSQQGDRAIKENPKTTHFPPLTRHLLTKAQQMCVCMSMFILKSIAQNDFSHLSCAVGAIFVFVSSAKNQKL